MGELHFLPEQLPGRVFHLFFGDELPPSGLSGKLLCNILRLGGIGALGDARCGAVGTQQGGEQQIFLRQVGIALPEIPGIPGIDNELLSQQTGNGKAGVVMDEGGVHNIRLGEGKGDLRALGLPDLGGKSCLLRAGRSLLPIPAASQPQTERRCQQHCHQTLSHRIHPLCRKISLVSIIQA